MSKQRYLVPQDDVRQLADVMLSYGRYRHGEPDRYSSWPDPLTDDRYAAAPSQPDNLIQHPRSRSRLAASAN